MFPLWQDSLSRGCNTITLTQNNTHQGRLGSLKVVPVIIVPVIFIRINLYYTPPHTLHKVRVHLPLSQYSTSGSLFCVSRKRHNDYAKVWTSNGSSRFENVLNVLLLFQELLTFWGFVHRPRLWKYERPSSGESLRRHVLILVGKHSVISVKKSRSLSQTQFPERRVPSEC
jgi:hypothetical protein